jgi:hypothetical protein
MNHLLILIEHHPASAFGICIINTIIAFTLPFMEIQIPIIAIQIFQLMAASVTIAVGLITLFKHYTGRPKKKKKGIR